LGSNIGWNERINFSDVRKITFIKNKYVTIITITIFFSIKTIKTLLSFVLIAYRFLIKINDYVYGNFINDFKK